MDKEHHCFPNISSIFLKVGQVKFESSRELRAK